MHASEWDPFSKCGSPLWKYSSPSSSMAPNTTFLHPSLDTENAAAKQERTAEATEIVHLSRRRRRGRWRRGDRVSRGMRRRGSSSRNGRRRRRSPFGERRARGLAPREGGDHASLLASPFTLPLNRHLEPIVRLHMLTQHSFICSYFHVFFY